MVPPFVPNWQGRRAFLSQTMTGWKSYVNTFLTLTLKFFLLFLGRMTNPEKIPTKRLNITFTNSAVDEVEQLRAKLENELKQRLSIAQVMKRLVKQALKPTE